MRTAVWRALLLARAGSARYGKVSHTLMASFQDQYDDAMLDFSRAEYDAAISKLEAILTHDPADFDARLSLGMAFYRKGDYGRAIAEGHAAEKLRPDDPLVHTNLSLFYMKSGDKPSAEGHGLKAKVASWKQDPAATPASDPALDLARPKTPPVKFSARIPDMPWKKKKTSE